MTAQSMVIVHTVSVDMLSVKVRKNGHKIINKIPMTYVRLNLFLIDDAVLENVDNSDDKKKEMIKANKTKNISK